MSFVNLYGRGKYIIEREGFKQFFLKGLKFLYDIFFCFVQRFSFFDNLLFSISLKRLKKLMDKEKNLSEIIETAYNYKGVGIFRTISPIQDKDEICHFVALINNRFPKVFVEIGTAFGGTLYTINRYVKTLKKVVCIDLDDRFYNFGYFKMRTKLLREFNKNIEINFLVGNSHDEKIEHDLKNILNGERIDVLFIDGDHSYDGTRDDFQRYSKYVSSNGIIAFHDILYSKFNVDPALCYRDIKNEYNYLDYKEIIARKEQVSGGIGLMYWGEKS